MTERCTTRSGAYQCSRPQGHDGECECEAPESPVRCLRCKGPAVRVQQTGELSCARQCAEGAVDMAKRIVLDEEVAVYARFLAEQMKSGVGFCLVLFNFGATGSMAYASTGRREDTVSMLRELLDKMVAEGGS